MNYPKEINTIKDLYNKAGYKVFIVGGCVRDHLLNIDVDDYDLATDATMEQGLKLLKESNIEAFPTGDSFPVLRTKIDYQEFEISTFRNDIGSGSNTTYAYGSIHEDASRRDFTFNAMYYDLETEKIIDFFDGQKDIKEKLLRFVGDPKTRIKEDRLRMMRAIRISQKLGFIIEKDSTNAILSNNRMFDVELGEEQISRERIFSEFNKAIKHTDFHYYMRSLHKFGLLEQILEKLDTVYDYNNIFKTDDSEKFHYYTRGSISEQLANIIIFNDDFDNETYCIETLKWSKDLYKEVRFLQKFENISNCASIGSFLNINELHKSYKKIFKISFNLNNWTENLNLDKVFTSVFLNYSPSVDGNDLIAKGLKGVEIATEKDRLENELFYNTYKTEKNSKMTT